MKKSPTTMEREKLGPLKPPFQIELLETTDGQDGCNLKVPLLPATYRNRQHMVRLVSADVQSFLESELDVSRLNCIHEWLWLCGLPTSPRALHYQRLKKRDIIVTEQLDLHLVWRPSRILIKPLPRFILSPQFWQQNICPDQELYRIALGFLLTYVALIEREVDYHIARNLNLLPDDITWPGWLALAEQIVTTSAQANAFLTPSSPSSMSSVSSLESHIPVNPRFFYGELRLGRLNWIYRLLLGKPRGYLSGCTTYGSFMRENVNSLITLFAYTTIVLSAMQVGLSTELLASNYAFGMASYVFCVFSILAPLTAIAFILFIISVLFVINLMRTLRIRAKRVRQGAGV